jgi:hypothetical protein
MKHEFKVTKSQNQTVYTLESASSGGTSSGSIASSSTALGGVLKRNPPGDNILAQEKKEVPKPRNFVAKNAKMGGAGQHKDKKKAEKQGDVKHKKPFSEASNPAQQAAIAIAKKKKAGMKEEFNGEYDDEAGMAHSNLLSSSRAVIGLLKTIKDRDNLPEWVQEKIAKAEMMLVGVWDYLQSQKEQGIDPQQDANENRYDRRDAYQRDYDSSVSGMDGSDKHAFKRAELQHELGHETNNIAISINGKLWKVVPGKGYADSREESQYLSNMKRWADTKSASSGKTWTVSLTGANPTEGVAEGAKVDRQAKHITASMMKKGKSKKDAESIAWAHIKHPKNESVDPYFEELMTKVEGLTKK